MKGKDGKAEAGREFLAAIQRALSKVVSVTPRKEKPSETVDNETAFIEMVREAVAAFMARL